jgi:hypothetical protein
MRDIITWLKQRSLLQRIFLIVGVLIVMFLIVLIINEPLNISTLIETSDKGLKPIRMDISTYKDVNIQFDYTHDLELIQSKEPYTIVETVQGSRPCFNLGIRKRSEPIEVSKEQWLRTLRANCEITGEGSIQINNDTGYYYTAKSGDYDYKNILAPAGKDTTYELLFSAPNLSHYEHSMNIIIRSFQGKP